MKKAFTIIVLFFLTGTISAQDNEISVDFSFFQNDVFVSGIGLNYFRNFTAKHAFGIRPAVTFNDRSSFGNQRTYQVDILGRTQINRFKSVDIDLDLGLAFLNTHERFYEAVRPEQSILDFEDYPVNYLGFSFGLSINRVVFEHFKIGLYHRTNLFFPIKEESEQNFIFRSRPNLFVSYTF